MTMNGIYITMRKGMEDRKFFLFIDGEAKELLENGWPGIIKDFHTLYERLTAEGFVEEA